MAIDFMGAGGSPMQGDVQQQMGAVDPTALNQIPHIPTPEPEIEQPIEQYTPKDELRKYIETVNIAENLDERVLTEIGHDAFAGYEADKASRAMWEQCVDDWIKLAAQVREQKMYPWPNASNVKYPLVSIASMQFAARAYPTLVPSDKKIVKTQVIGKDPDGKKKERADRVSTYMSYQIFHEMDGWEEGMDKLLNMVPVVGTMFKKTFFDPVKGKNCSYIIQPKNLVTNYWISCLEECERVSEIIEMSPRKVKEKQLAGVFLDVELGPPTIPNEDTLHTEVTGMLRPQVADDTTPYTLIEQHTFLDLNGDGYKEPYVVTFELGSRKVLRISARFDDRGIHTNDEGKVIRIDPICYYTKYGFIPNPDGSFYDIGFGHLLGPINESVNTLINQLIDSGTLNNLQGGFIGKGLRLKMGETRMEPGEWKAVNATGDDLRKQIVPLPTKEPSNVLFQLMGALVTSGKELASVAEIFVGKMPGQNTPATTTMATIEQGMKVFTAIYKRIYRSLEEEFKKLFRLNEVYLDPQTYIEVLDAPIGPEDFNTEDYQICPAADPTAVSQTEKLIKAQALLELLPIGTIDPLKVTMRVLEAMEQPNWQDLISPSAGQPQEGGDPAAEAKQMELMLKQQVEQQKMELKAQEQAFKSELAMRDQIFKQQMEEYKIAKEAELKERIAMAEFQRNVHQDNYRLAREQQRHAVQLRQSEEAHKQKVNQAKEQPKSQARKNSGSGKSTR